MQPAVAGHPRRRLLSAMLAAAGVALAVVLVVCAWQVLPGRLDPSCWSGKLIAE